MRPPTICAPASPRSLDRPRWLPRWLFSPVRNRQRRPRLVCGSMHIHYALQVYVAGVWKRGRCPHDEQSAANSSTVRFVNLEYKQRPVQAATFGARGLTGSHNLWPRPIPCPALSHIPIFWRQYSNFRLKALKAHFFGKLLSRAPPLYS